MHFVGPDHRKQNFMCPYPSWGPINGQTVAAGLYPIRGGGTPQMFVIALNTLWTGVSCIHLSNLPDLL